jgi:hypothetical protein
VSGRTAKLRGLAQDQRLVRLKVKLAGQRATAAASGKAARI